MLGRILVRGERLIKFGYIWFSAKSILVECGGANLFRKISTGLLGVKLFLIVTGVAPQIMI